MIVGYSRELSCGGAKVHCDDDLVYEFACLRSDNCSAKDFATRRIDNKFDEAMEVPLHHRLSVIRKWVAGA